MGAAGLHLFAVTPSGETILLDRENDDSSQGGGSEQNGTVTGTVPRTLPDGSHVMLKLVIWPGETTVWVNDLTIESPSSEPSSTDFTTAEDDLEESEVVSATTKSTDTGTTTTSTDFEDTGQSTRTRTIDEDDESDSVDRLIRSAEEFTDQATKALSDIDDTLEGISDTLGSLSDSVDSLTYRVYRFSG
jgi:hypothetical protein